MRQSHPLDNKFIKTKLYEKTLNEYELAKELTHPNIVKYKDLIKEKMD